MPDPNRWEQVQALFHHVADLDEEARSAFLRDACAADPSMAADVRRMIESDSRSSFLDRDVAALAGGILQDPLPPLPKEFGPYRIVRLLGEGGMGVVYLAERTDLGNLVAVKILRDAWLSPARRRRFVEEQRTLARLNHPAIARLYDASTLADGTPWFVMEFVDGVPTTEYCRRRQSSLEDRLRLIRATAEAVQYAHDSGVIHRDLKPSNIFVKEDGSIKLLDFGISKQLDEAGKPLYHTSTAVRSLTVAYASPQQIRGEPVHPSMDVYSLGVVLYELLAERLPFDLEGKTVAEAEQVVTTREPEPLPWSDLDALCRTAMHKDPDRRYASCGALIGEIDRYLRHEPLQARRRTWSNPRTKPAALVATVALLLAAASLERKPAPKGASPTPARSVAVLPLTNATPDRGLDYLSTSLADEVSRTLGYARSLSLRAPEAGRKFTGPNVNLQQAGRELHASTVVSGRFLKSGDQLQITLDLTDVPTNRPIWSDVFDAPAGDLMAMQAQVASKTRRSMAPLLGVTEFMTDSPPRPRNEQAYRLYLQATAIPEEISTDSATRQHVIDLLNQSTALDPTYAPAWEALAWTYAYDGWFGTGGAAAIARFRAVTDKVIALDPENMIFRVGALYYWGTLGNPTGSPGGFSRGEAYRQVEDLLRRRPDNSRLHFLASWILRDTGMLAESARECDTSVLIDAEDAGARSCGVTFMLLGNYRRALDYLNLDPDAEISRAVSIDVLVRQGDTGEALNRMRAKPLEWGAYSVLRASLEHRPAAEIAALANRVEPATDPEINFFSAAHLAYAGQDDDAMAMLEGTIGGGYCSYPAIDTDPFFASLRSKPSYRRIRQAAQQCQNDFLAQRGSSAKP